MWDWLGKIISRVNGLFWPRHGGLIPVQEPDFFAVMDQARQEREDARAYFNCVTDPDLVDHAIYLEDAAEKKFLYLIKTAKANGITLSTPAPIEITLSYRVDVRA